MSPCPRSAESLAYTRGTQGAARSTSVRHTRPTTMRISCLTSRGKAVRLPRADSANRQAGDSAA
eukprot:1738315-Pyramimonas_sp.AAC.1